MASDGSLKRTARRGVWSLALLITSAAIAAVLFVATPPRGLAQDGEADEWRDDLAAAVAQLASDDAARVAAARDQIRAIAAAGHDVGPALRGALEGSEIGAVVEASMLLKELKLPYAANDAETDGETGTGAAGTSEDTPPPTLSPAALRALLRAPTQIALHQEPAPAVGQAIEVAFGDPEDADAPREVLAIVGVDDEAVTLWIEHRYMLIDRVVVLMLVDAIDGSVLEAYGGHQPPADPRDADGSPVQPRVGAIIMEGAHAATIAPGGTARLTTLAPADAQRKTVELPAGTFTDARVFTHTITIHGAGGDRDVQVEDAIAPSVYFDALLRRRLVGTDRRARTLVRQWDDAEQTVWPE